MQKFINEHLVLASGLMKSCIYDLDRQVMYRISNNLKDDIVDFFAHKNQSEKYLKDIGILHPNEYLYEYHQTFEDSVTFSWIEITSNCNFFCKHCYNGERQNKELSYDDVNKIFIKLKKMGINNIQITGGEPLLHSSFDNILKLSTTYFKSAEVFTNSYLIDDAKLSLIKSNNVNLAISIHSLNKNENDFITGVRGALNKTLENINKIKNHDINFRLVSVKTKWTPSDVHMDDIKVKNDPVRIVGRANLALMDRSILRKKLITEEYFTKKLDSKFVLRNFFRHNCFGSKIYVSCNGDCYPCVMERRIKLGNIINGDIEYNIYSVGKQFSKENIEECSHCEYRLACYDCRSDALSDNVWAKPWFCTYSPKEATWRDPDLFMDSILLN